MIASYYFWKWADNDLPGKPPEVHAALLRGELHPALQIFDARPLLTALADAAAEARSSGEEWNWEAQPSDAPERARFVFVTCPQVNTSEARVRHFMNRFTPLDLSGCDDRGGKLIPGFHPKLNYFITGQLSEHHFVYDIMAEELPFLLRRIRPERRNPWGDLWTRWKVAVAAIAEGRRFRVEWREWPNKQKGAQVVYWRALDPKQLTALASKGGAKASPKNVDASLLTYAATLKIFEACLRGEPRPPQYCWRRMKKSLLP